MTEDRCGPDSPKTHNTRRTRRHFLKSDVPGALGAVLTSGRVLNAALAAGIVGLWVTEKYHEYEFIFDFLQNKHDKARIDKIGYYNEVIQHAREFLEKELGFDLKLNFGWRDDELEMLASPETIPLDTLRDMLVMVVQEFVKYPEGFTKSDHLWREQSPLIPLFFISDLKRARDSGTPYDIGGRSGIRWRKGKPEVAYIALSTRSRGHDRHALHHEFNHSFIFSLSDEEYEKKSGAWLETHEGIPGFNGTADSIYRRFSIRTRGFDFDGSTPFISDYSKGYVTEDMAEWAGVLMMPNEHLALRQGLNGPPGRYTNILKKKYELIKSFYLEWSDGKMDDKYWDEFLKT